MGWKIWNFVGINALNVVDCSETNIGESLNVQIVVLFGLLMIMKVDNAYYVNKP